MQSPLPLVAILVLTSGQALAQDDPSFDCARAEGAAEDLICADPGLAALDRRLAERFAAAVSVVQGLDAGAEEAEAELRTIQRGWIKGRDDCWKADDLRACVEEAYLAREGDLVARYILEAPFSETLWACDGNPSNAVNVSFFDTELPSIRIEYGDSIDTGHLALSGSGARYEASFGREFWEKGPEAQFTWEEGRTMTCELVAG